MTAKKRKFWNIPPEEEQTGLLLWFQILQKHYLKLFGANAIAVLSLLPCAYFVYLLVQTGDIVFWVVGLALFVLASPCQTGLHSVCVRLVHRMPVWVKDEFINAWKQEWKPSVLLGLILGVPWSMLAYGAYMVVAVDGGMSVGYLLLMLLAAYFLTGLTLFGYQQIAMLELPFGTQLKNAALLIFAGKLRAFFAIVVWVGMLLVPVIYYGLAAYILLAGWVAIGVMTANEKETGTHLVLLQVVYSGCRAGASGCGEFHRRIGAAASAGRRGQHCDHLSGAGGNGREDKGAV